MEVTTSDVELYIAEYLSETSVVAIVLWVGTRITRTTMTTRMIIIVSTTTACEDTLA